ncbi:hypothetical protein [Pedobacter aquatilis]|uniref:hypothetical protein n=1 Tax=Pedobacter aquatilis TaxID=351343 RepID=UPI0029306DBD|nr:hypothetical protein [Pedobacter aquatilis]
MCIVIDTNSLAAVFDSNSANHSAFKPLYDWIVNGKGMVVYGGTKYLAEIQKYVGVFNELKKQNKAVKINDEAVDEMELTVSKQVVHVDFDDQHLIALLMVSKTRLICSLDQRAYKFFKHQQFFSRASDRPKIFRGTPKNKTLLADNNIADICKKCKIK